MPLAAPEHLAAVEHRGAQGPFVGLGPLDPGWLPLLSTRVAVAATGFLSRNLFASGSLMGLRTVHFFQLHIDADRRLIFSSTFDGTLESYMDDFIDKLARGLNAIFGGAAGYPRTTLVVLGSMLLLLTVVAMAIGASSRPASPATRSNTQDAIAAEMMNPQRMKRQIEQDKYWEKKLGFRSDLDEQDMTWFHRKKDGRAGLDKPSIR